MPPIAILVALADPTRCRLIELLREGPQPVHVLAAAFKISRPAISRHLRVLKQSGLISENKFGRENRYALHPKKLAPVQRWLADFLPGAKTPAEVPKTIKETSAEVKPVETPHIAIAAPVGPIAADPEPIAAPVAERPNRPAKAKKPATPVEAPAISQMGFDF
jgi:DNA-binding transcriptional ArsR family regulator